MQWTSKELDRQDRIIAVATRLMALHGRPAITLANLALALAMSPGTIRRYFCDLDNILAEILRRHLAALVTVTATIPPDTPCCQAARRAAYIEATSNVARVKPGFHPGYVTIFLRGNLCCSTRSGQP